MKTRAGLIRLVVTALLAGASPCALAQEDPAVADQDAAGAALHGPGALAPQRTR